MNSPGGNTPGLVRPGEGVSVDFERLALLRDELRSGTFVIDDAQERVREALADLEVSEDEALSILDLPPNKTFRNAYTSILMEQVWPSYSALATGDDVGLYALHFNDTDATLLRQPPETVADLPLHNIADLIAASNQGMATYYACGLFSGGRAPEVCGDPETDSIYFAAFREHTELQFSRTREFFKAIPPLMGSPIRFLASGLQVIRTYVFGVPNLIDGVAANEGVILTPDQHRTGTESTLTRVIPMYYPLTGPLIIAINSVISDPETHKLHPDNWTSNGNPDNYLVFPKPGIVQSVNEAFAQRDDLPIQTGCPVIHSRVPAVEASGATMPLPRSLARIALEQLDVLYYPQRQQEYEET
jgi:hypothetical protein